MSPVRQTTNAGHSRITGLLLGLLLSVVGGCSSIRCKSVWFEGGTPSLSILNHAHSLIHDHAAHGDSPESLDPLRLSRQRFVQGETLADWNSPDGVDEFYSAALWSWYAGAEEETGQARSVYNRSVARLIYEGQLHHRLDPRRGLNVRHAGAQRTVPVEIEGFAWDPDDFQELKVVGLYCNQTLVRSHTAEGVGVPVVVLRHKSKGAKHETDFLPPVANFAATAVLKPDGSALVLYNPLKHDCVTLDGQSVPLARDLSASVAYGLHHHPSRRLQDFFRPYRHDDPSLLYFLEPFQEDKIPVILVHGLLSSPDAWANIYNELRTKPDILCRYQFWAFQYSTGAPFVRSAASLRDQLNKVQSRFGGEDTNGQLQRSVLIGHSMGGLVSKLMIAHSGDSVWNAIAKVPLENVRTDEVTRASLAERLYFDPHPMASRVVFIASPHRGSSVAGRACGKLASSLVVQNNAALEQMVRANPGAFRETVENGFPTSIDMLNPKEPFLDVLNCLPLKDGVPLHSIIGTKCDFPGHQPSDGIVNLDSAKQAGVQSEVLIPATHNGLLRQDATVTEIVRILRLHAAAPVPAAVPSVSGTAQVAGASQSASGH